MILRISRRFSGRRPLPDRTVHRVGYVLVTATVLITGCADRQPAAAPQAPASVARGNLPQTVVTSGTIPVPDALCSIASTAQQTADAFMGAVSAGDPSQARSCVQHGAVPETTLAQLVSAPEAHTAYLPVTTGTDTFTYQRQGKTVTVTVGKQPDGHYLVTGITAS